jgi:hypothetical protein
VRRLALSVCLLLSVCVLAEDSAKPEDVALATRGAQALKQRLFFPDSLKISKVVVTTRSFKDGSDVEVCYEYRAKNKSGQYADRDMAVYSSSKGKEKLKLGEELFHKPQSECNFNSRTTKTMKAVSTDITSVFEKLSPGKSASQTN